MNIAKQKEMELQGLNKIQAFVQCCMLGSASRNLGQGGDTASYNPICINSSSPHPARLISHSHSPAWHILPWPWLYLTSHQLGVPPCAVPSLAWAPGLIELIQNRKWSGLKWHAHLGWRFESRGLCNRVRQVVTWWLTGNGHSGRRWCGGLAPQQGQTACHLPCLASQWASRDLQASILGL